MAGSLEQPGRSDGLPRGQVGGQQYRSAEWNWSGVDVPSSVLSHYPNAGLYVAGSYASVWDVVDISLPEDSRHDWSSQEIQRWLIIGAARIDEHLGQRGWNVPLVWWSETVVWANSELAYVGLYRKRGGGRKVCTVTSKG